MYRRSSFSAIKFTKIVATISGATCTRELLEDLFDRGMDVMRMNTAHMSIEEMERLVAMAREVSPQLSVMLDTKGPNIRTCNVPADGVSLKEGETVRISGEAGDDGRIQVNYAPFDVEVPVGSTIVCDDGAAKFLVVGKEGGCLLAKALFNCTVLNKKSVNVPDVSLKAPALTDRDREFLAAAVRLRCDFIAHSFVRNAADIAEVRKALGNEGKDIAIIAKIENREGVNNINEILMVADGIMVARGDLGIEIPLEEVPAIQKDLIHKARQVAKPVITATQMLQSMENAPAPTRAEVSDVANAVYDGTDAVMLSGETAHGQYPRESVSMMASIVMEAERAPMCFFPKLVDTPEASPVAAFILASAAATAEHLPVKVLICCSLHGRSARVCSAYRMRIPIFAPTPSEMTMRQLSLSYGTYSLVSEYNEDPGLQAMHAFEQFTSLPASLSLDDDTLVAMVSKHSCGLKRNNLLCLATIAELKSSIKDF